MAVVIVVEDGTGIANANSYVSLAELRDYATQRRLTLPNDDDDASALLIKSTDYLETQGPYLGQRAASGQALQWPRVDSWNLTAGLEIDGVWYNAPVLPTRLLAAQMALAMIVNSGVDLSPTQTTAMVVREKVDVIETQYSDKFGLFTSPIMPTVDALLAPLLDVSRARRNIRV